MSWTVELQRQIRDLGVRMEAQIKQAIAHLFVYTNTSRSSTIGDEDAVESSDEGVDPGTTQKGQRPVVRILPYGLASRQPSGLRGLSIQLGRSNVFYLGIGPTEKMGPQSLDVGEVCVWNNGGVQVYLDKNGNVIITPTGSGIVQVGGNSYALPQWDPFISALGTLSSTIAGLVAATDLASVITLANGIRTAFVTFNSALSAASSWKSTKAKNG